MKKFAIILLMGGVLLSGCNYLDIVPDERNTPENTYQNPQAARIICILVIQKCLIRE